MKLFGINIGSNKPSELRITSADREWVESNFQWLVKVFGHPRKDQISISEKYFPQTFSSKEINIENLIADCCNQLELDRDLFSYEIYEDIRDNSNMPYAFEGYPIDCFLHYDEKSGKYLIVLAKSIFKHPNWLIASICYELVRARLIQSKVEYDTGEDTNLFLYLASVYFGYGVIIGQNLSNIGRSMDAIWETKWSYIADIPYPVLAYALATFARLQNNLAPSWKDLLAQEIKTEFDLSIEYIGKSNNELFDARQINNALNADKLFELADIQYQSKEISKAISTLQKIVFLTDDNMLKADVYNNIGYYKLRLGQYEKSISDFQNALNLDPNYGYANDNLGFAFIMIGELDKGKNHLDRAIKTGNNDDAYSFRNMALYYQKKGDFEASERFFQMAFDKQSHVDLLDFFFGQFLIEKGDDKKGSKHIQISADIGEPEGIELLRKINNN